jgi:hypothetical protein
MSIRWNPSEGFLDSLQQPAPWLNKGWLESRPECGLELVKGVTTAPDQKIHYRGAFDDQKAITVVLFHARAVRGNGFRTETHSPEVGIENLAARPQGHSKLSNERRESRKIWVAAV